MPERDRMLRLRAEEMAYEQYGQQMARMGDEVAKLRARIAELEAENARMREICESCYHEFSQRDNNNANRAMMSLIRLALQPDRGGNPPIRKE